MWQRSLFADEHALCFFLGGGAPKEFNSDSEGTTALSEKALAALLHIVMADCLTGGQETAQKKNARVMNKQNGQQPIGTCAEPNADAIANIDTGSDTKSEPTCWICALFSRRWVNTIICSCAAVSTT